MKEAIWNAEEPEDGLTSPRADMPEEERKKKEEERAKKLLEEVEEVNTVAKRKGHRIYVHGCNFSKSENLMLRFAIDNFAPVFVAPVFKSTKLLGAVIPHMGNDVPIGQHPMFVEVTLNGQ
jgi:hypothetical protein